MKNLILGFLLLIALFSCKPEGTVKLAPELGKCERIQYVWGLDADGRLEFDTGRPYVLSTDLSAGVLRQGEFIEIVHFIGEPGLNTYLVEVKACSDLEL